MAEETEYKFIRVHKDTYELVQEIVHKIETLRNEKISVNKAVKLAFLKLNEYLENL